MLFELPQGILWVVIIVGALVIEAFTLSLNAIWFALGGVGGLVAASLGTSTSIQWIVFLIVSAIFLFLARPMVRKLIGSKKVATNADRILGEQGIVTQRIDNTNAQGQIKIMGQYWTARSANGVPIEKDCLVRVCEIVGVKAIVEAIETDNKC